MTIGGALCVPVLLALIVMLVIVPALDALVHRQAARHVRASWDAQYDEMTAQGYIWSGTEWGPAGGPSRAKGDGE
jgi:hypothetical protein